MKGMLELALPQSSEIIKVAVEQIQDWLVVTDRDGKILYINRQVEMISGYKKNELIGQKPSIWKSGESSRQNYTDLWHEILNGRAYYGVIANRCKNGEVFYLANTISPVHDEEGIIQYFISTAKDITKNYELKRQLNDVIHYDSLTQLPNKTSFVKEIEETVCASKNAVILVISIQNLNIVNNTYGFVYADHVIRKIAKKIQEVVDEQHILARIESHTFAILVPKFNNLSEIVSLINTIEEKVGSHITFKEEELYIELLTGVGVSPGDAASGITLLARAQTALTKVEEENNSHTYAFYTSEMGSEAQIQLYVENDTFKAYQNDEFIPFFQPFIDIETGKISGVEALMRRKNTAGEIIPPSEFIGVLERMGLIEKTEMRFIKKVCNQIRTWLDSGYKVVPVAINLSPLQFQDKDLTQKIVKIVSQAGIPRKLITIEVTESLFMGDLVLAKSILEALKEEGFVISIDDFGTGYSSFTYLKEFDADQLKIDMSFIEEIISNQKDQAIVRAIVAVADALQMKTVAEGIESAQQLDLVRELGCDIGQGHYWDIALPEDEIARKYLIS